jgi:2-methylcitrate dehydratase PrpD
VRSAAALTALVVALAPAASRAQLADLRCVPSHAALPNEQSLAEQLGVAVAATRYEDLSPEVIERLKLTVLDNLATLAYTTRLTRDDPFVRRAAARRGGDDARIWGSGLRTSVEDSAATTAWLIHAAETDDSDFRASLRASPVIMGPVLAMAEARRSSGRDFLLSLAVGYTMLGRTAAPLGPLQLRGTMSSGVWGPPAGAAATARLLGMDAGQTANAIAIAGSASGGPFQYFYDQTEEKRLIVARAARASIDATLLACAGERGARRIYEGTAGLYALYGGTPSPMIDLAAITNNFAALEGPLRLRPKFYAASASIIPFLEEIAPVRAQIDAEQIDHYIVRGGADAARIYRARIENYAPPPTLIGAQTSLPFVLALYLRTGSADAYSFSATALADPATHQLAQRGRFVLADGPTELAIVMRYGRIHRFVPIDSNGSSDEPLMLEARLAKFDSLTRDVLTDAERAQVRSLVDRLDETTDMAAWIEEVERLFRL